MEAYYPISALAHGQALNITVMSYAGGLYFGFTACADRVPSVQRLAVYTGEALDELEAVFGKGTAAAGAKPKTGRKAKPTRRKSALATHVKTIPSASKSARTAKSAKVAKQSKGAAAERSPRARSGAVAAK